MRGKLNIILQLAEAAKHVEHADQLTKLEEVKTYIKQLQEHIRKLHDQKKLMGNMYTTYKDRFSQLEKMVEEKEKAL